ncbi:MAG: endonuclease/exonuclease/phosphatase family protein [Planctomycetota bacterium]
MSLTPIHRIQGSGLFSDLDGQTVTTRGVVTGSTRKGFFIQDPEGDVDEAVSHGVFVFERRRQPSVHSLVEVEGKVVNYQPAPNARPTTQLVERTTRVLLDRGPQIRPFWLTADRVLVDHPKLTALLNSLEGMLVGVPAGSTFVAPSNSFGDYVVLPPDAELTRTEHGGVLIDPRVPERWLPGFRVLDYADAPTVSVGAELVEAIVGPLNFRVASYQMAVSGPVRIRNRDVEPRTTDLRHEDSSVTVLTLNGFNLDIHKEHPDRVNDPRRDIDDDVGDGRFHAIGAAIANNAASPTIVALQEIQDNDGAELSTTVDAAYTYKGLIVAIQHAGGPTYAWAEIPPEDGADGGQPGGNIRNAFLYDPSRVELVAGSLQLLGSDSPAYVGSRKPLAARFRLKNGGGELEVINVHLASKRHQNGQFAPEQPSFDPRQTVRVEQAEVIADRLAQLRQQAVDYYVTGDFNDFEFSPTLRALTGDHSTNLVDRVPAPLRFDYNHRGTSQALMHGVVAKRQLEGRSVAYDILHHNALIGSQPGRTGDKASDHAYAVAKLELRRA